MLKKLALACFGVVLALGVLEGALQLLASKERFHVWPPFTQRTQELDPKYVPGITGPSEFRVNSLGLRGDERPDGAEPVVLAVGGSTTECLTLDQTEAWPRLVQDALGDPAWVGNAGRSGHSTREHVYQVPRLLELVPDADAVVILTGANDLGLRLQQDTDYDPGFLQRAGADERMIPRAFAVYPADFAGHLPWYKRLELYARARTIKNLLARDRGAAQDERGESLARWRANRARASELRTELPDLGPALDEYRRNLRAMVEDARAGGAKVVLMTQPTLWRSDLDDAAKKLLWWGGVGEFQQEGAEVPYYTVEALADGMRRYNDVVREVAIATNTTLVDLAKQLPKTTAIFYDDMHFTEEGARRVAALVARAVGSPR